MDSIFQALNFSIPDFIAQIVNIGIILFVLNKFFFKKVGKVIDERKKQIEEDMTRINQVQVEAEERSAQYDELLQHAKDETNVILGKAREDGEALKHKRHSEAENEATAILEKARRDIEQEKVAAIASIQHEVADLVAISAAKVLEGEVSDKTQEELMDSFIRDAGELDG